MSKYVNNFFSTTNIVQSILKPDDASFSDLSPVISINAQVFESYLVTHQ